MRDAEGACSTARATPTAARVLRDVEPALHHGSRCEQMSWPHTRLSGLHLAMAMEHPFN